MLSYELVLVGKQSNLALSMSFVTETFGEACDDSQHIHIVDKVVPDFLSFGLIIKAHR